MDGDGNVGGASKYSGSNESVIECSAERASDVIGPEVNGDRTSARNGAIRVNGESAVMSSNQYPFHTHTHPSSPIDSA